jgi:hypothetical protein
MEAAISEGDGAGSDEGGGECSDRYGSRRGRGARGRQRTHESAVAVSWPSD